MTLFDTADAELLPAGPSDRTRVATRVRAPAWPRRTFALAIVCLLSIAVAGFAIWPLTSMTVPWDSKNQFYPMFRFLGDALRHGTVPLWNPYQYSGYPSVADPQSLLFTPTMLVFALIAPNATMSVFDAVVFGHLVMGAVGVLGLAKRWRWHPSAGLLAAIIFMLGGAASSRLQHTGMIISYSWYPLALWSLQAALDRRSMRLAIVAGLFATLMAVGRDQVAFLLCIALVGAVLRQAFRSEDWRAYLRARAPVVSVAGLVTVTAMIVPILLALQFVRDSNRPGIAYGMALVGSLDPINLLTLLAPNLFGSLDRARDYWGPGGASYSGTDWTDPSVDYLFAGTVPFVLLVWQGLAGGRLLERGARYFAILMASAFVYALGRHTALFGLIFDWVPGVSLYRRPADASFLFNIALAFASGYLLHRFVEEGLPRLDLIRPRAATLLILTSVALAWLTGASLAFARQAGHLDRSLLSLAGAFGLAALVVAVLVALRARQRRGLAAALLVAATAGQLVWHNAASPLNAEPVSRYAANAELPANQESGLAVLRADIAAHPSAGADPRVEVQGVDGPWQNAALMFKLQNLAGYNPLRIAAYERAVGIAESTNDPKLRTFPDTFRGYNSRLAAMLGLDYLVIDRPINELPRHYPRPHATLLFGSAGFYIYRLDTTAVPRVHLATRIMPVDSDDVIDGGDIPDFDVVHEALVDQADIGALKNRSLVQDDDKDLGTAPSDASSAEIVDYADNHVRIVVEAQHDGLLVLHDIAYPGWFATVDGRATPIVRTDLLFRGVELAAGHHTVEFSFQPFAISNLVAAGRVIHKDEE